ncbi:hypothetical protein GBN28_00740 [Plesiomonas shigelloides]|nr:hypothetical protein GBN23_00590 [Plesiomonas shigelloides]KAB7693505.1 hypothetical protein GBN28_00740 [Plesiomonas shigelloides]
MSVFRLSTFYEIGRFTLYIYCILIASSTIVTAETKNGLWSANAYNVVGDEPKKINAQPDHKPDSSNNNFTSQSSRFYNQKFSPEFDIASIPELEISGSNKNIDIEMLLAEQAKRMGEAYTGYTINDVDSNITSGAYFTGRIPSKRLAFVDNEIDNVKRQLKSSFEFETKSYVTSAFSDFGNVNVGLMLDDSFGLQKFSIDILSSLNESDGNLFFLQGGGRYDRHANTAVLNFGLGHRHFLGPWMVGYNAFFDHEIHNHHSRIGIGAEAWADYTKLSLNMYAPLSNWRESKSVDNYLERAAHGLDINARYYLPQYPNLSLSAKVEQYFGNEISIATDKKRVENPYSGTVGIEWQPMPLLKVGIDHRIIKGSASDTVFNLGFEWKFGSSLKDMTSSYSSILTKNLQGMRTDIVERNYDIALAYKEKDRIVAIEHSSIIGKPEQRVLLMPRVTISHGQIVKYEWISPDPLLSAGIENIYNKNSQLILPNIKPNESSMSHVFPLYLFVTDEKGRGYKSQEISVTVLVEPDSKNDTGIDESAMPMVRNLRMAGKLEVGQILTGNYRFDPNGGHPDDRSTYAWGSRGETAANVPTGGEVTATGQIPPLQLTLADVGEIKELSVQARNGLAITGNTLTVDSNMGTAGGDDTSGGADSDGNGKTDTVINPAVGPQISNLRIAGKLEVGQELSGSYVFNANGGNQEDKSTYAWGNRGETAADVTAGQTIVVSGHIPVLALTTADVGEIKELSIQARNGLAITGNTLTIDSSLATVDGDDTTGGGSDGEVVDPNNIQVSINYVSTATESIHGTTGGTYTGSETVRAVANVDEMTAMCQIAGELSSKPCDARFELRWYVNGNQINNAFGATFTPSSADQGYPVVVEANLKP